MCISNLRAVTNHYNFLTVLFQRLKTWENRERKRAREYEREMEKEGEKKDEQVRIYLDPVVGRVDNAFHRINLCPVVNITYPLNSRDLSGTVLTTLYHMSRFK